MSILDLGLHQTYKQRNSWTLAMYHATNNKNRLHTASEIKTVITKHNVLQTLVYIDMNREPPIP